jgi:hypothetical protein
LKTMFLFINIVKICDLDCFLTISTDLDVCRIVLKKQSDLFHPLNLLRAKTLDAAFESAIELGQWEDAVVYGKILLPAFQ